MLDATFAFHIESFVIALGVEFILDHTTGAFHKESCCGEFYTRYQGNWFCVEACRGCRTLLSFMLDDRFAFHIGSCGDSPIA